MATLVSKPNWGRLILQGLVAGIVGGILLDVFLALTTHTSFAQTLQYAASSSLGKVAYTSAAYAWTGLLLYAIGCIAWAVGYAYVAATSPRVVTTPWLSGLVFGIVVWLAMTIVLMFDQVPGILDTASIPLRLVALGLFYGIPVALLVRIQASRT